MMLQVWYVLNHEKHTYVCQKVQKETFSYTLVQTRLYSSAPPTLPTQFSKQFILFSAFALYICVVERVRMVQSLRDL